MRLHYRFSFGLHLLFVILFATITITQLPRWFHIIWAESPIDQGGQKQLYNINLGKRNSSTCKQKSLHGAKTSPNRYIELERVLQDLLVQEKGTGCMMPDIDPFSPEFSKFYRNVPVVPCNGDDWVECNFSQCYVKQSVLDRMKNVSCTYKDIVYVNDDKYHLGNAVNVDNGGKYTLSASDYVKISCIGLEAQKLEQFEWVGRKAGFRPLPALTTHSTSLNVLLLLIDSASRNAFIRRMPISYGVLKDELLAVVMNSYNVVGYGTHEAMWPLLTGHNELELPDSRKWPGNKRRVGTKPFIFTLMKENGYRTAYLEDMPWTGTFNRLNNGFGKMPADHYMRHLSKSIGICDRTYWTTSEQSTICFGSESIFKFMVEYSAKLFKLNGKKFCVTVTASYSHDDINTLTLADEDLARFLRRFKRDGHLEDTLLFVMGDHGPKISGVRNTYVGKIDENHPFISVVLPERLKSARPDALPNLKVNSEVLTTAFDVHTTMLDALGLKEHRNKYTVPGADIERGMSFLKPIPHSRGCADAGIVPHFCTCSKKWQDLSREDIFYTKVSRKLANFINVVTSPERHKCAKRKLLSIEWVHRLGPIENMETSSNVYHTFYEHRHRKVYPKYYQAKIIMGPRKAIFEGTMLYDFDTDSFNVSDRDISRIDRYGDEPICVLNTHPHLSKYCNCNSG